MQGEAPVITGVRGASAESGRASALQRRSRGDMDVVSGVMSGGAALRAPGWTGRWVSGGFDAPIVLSVG